MAYVIRKNDRTARLKPIRRRRWEFKGYIAVLILGALLILKSTSGYLFSDHPRYGVLPETNEKYLVEANYSIPPPLSDKRIITAEHLARETQRAEQEKPSDKEHYFLMELEDGFFDNGNKKPKEGAL